MNSDARFICGPYTADVGAHQWGFVDSYRYLERRLGETPYFCLHRELYGITIPGRTARWARIQTIMEPLRNLGIYAGLTSTPVTFIPDISDPGTTWLVDWPDFQATKWVIENRDEMIIRLTLLSEEAPEPSPVIPESPGVPGSSPGSTPPPLPPIEPGEPGAPSDPGVYGPQASIAPPGGAVSISPGTNIQTVINANPAGTTYGLLAGTHLITASLVPKTGDTFVGEYGAILDASGWSTSDGEAGVFRAVNNNIDNVTIRNLRIINGPQYGINAYFSSSGWIVEYSEISGFLNGVSLGIGGILRNSWVHHNFGVFNDPNVANRGGGYTFNASQGAQVIDNEISYNGQEQKFIYGTIGGFNQDLYIARNYVHHNLGDGLWLDGDGANSIIEDNICDDNGRTGITIEIGTTIIVRTNTCRRNGEEGILISATRDSQVYSNIVQDNGGGIALFLDFSRLAETYPYWTIDLSGNDISSNVIRSNAPSRFLALLTFTGSGTQTPYLNNTKDNQYINNTYVVPSSLTSNWFVWNGAKSFTQWQALPQDTGGSISIG